MRHNIRRTRSSFGAEILEPRTLMSTWSTVDDFTLGPRGVGGAFSMAADSGGNVYAAGEATDSAGILQAVVREKFAASSSWTTIESFDYSDGKGAHFNAITVDKAGDVYVGGQSLSGHFLVLERAANQSAFSVIDDVPPTDSKIAGCNALAFDGAGDLFAVGYQANGDRWMVRRQSAGQVGFTTVDTFADKSGALTGASAVTVTTSGPNAGIYVAGEDAGRWLVRKSSDNGSSWSTVDNFLYFAGAGDETLPFGMTADHSGNVYVVGIGDGATDAHWLVRKSMDGGRSWTIDDDFQFSTAPGSFSRAWGIGTDLAGNVYVTGTGRGPSFPGIFHALTRSNVGGKWTTVDDFQLVAGQGNQGNFAVTTDTAGNLYTGGFAQPVPGGPFHWIVRSAPAPAPTLDFSMLVTIARHYNQPGTFADGDLNGDGNVGFDDLVILARNYGQPLPGPSADVSFASAMRRPISARRGRMY